MVCLKCYTFCVYHPLALCPMNSCKMCLQIVVCYDLEVRIPWSGTRSQYVYRKHWLLGQRTGSSQPTFFILAVWLYHINCTAILLHWTKIDCSFTRAVECGWAHGSLIQMKYWPRVGLLPDATPKAYWPTGKVFSFSQHNSRRKRNDTPRSTRAWHAAVCLRSGK